jgi:hypothetical protein
MTMRNFIFVSSPRVYKGFYVAFALVAANSLLVPGATRQPYALFNFFLINVPSLALTLSTHGTIIYWQILFK